jgi:hypothetical protein
MAEAITPNNFHSLRCAAARFIFFEVGVIALAMRWLKPLLLTIFIHGGVSRLLCLTASNKMTAVATATFNDSVLACIGIEIELSANVRAISLAPCASLPTIRAAGLRHSTAV